MDCADARPGRGRGWPERPGHTPVTGRGRGMSCPGPHLLARVAFLPAGAIGPQAFLSDLSLPHNTPGTANGAAKPPNPPPGHGHDC